MASFPSTTITTAAATDQDGATAITAVHPDVIHTHILTRLDGPTLASASCASSQLRSLSNEENLWKDLCNSTWPSTTHTLVHRAISSFPSGHRSFFSDSFPAFNHLSRHRQHSFPTWELISAVDIHHQNRHILSKVKITETASNSFRCSTFWIDLLERKEKVATQVKFAADVENLRKMKDYMSLSWILIDPGRKRAVNLSSLMPVSVKRHWLTGDIHAKYATVIGTGDCCTDRNGKKPESVQCRITVTCEGAKEEEELRMIEVSMRLEDTDGRVLSGKKGVAILQRVMDGERRRQRSRREEEERYEEYKLMKRERRKRRRRKEKMMNSVCAATAANMLFVTMVCLTMAFIFSLLF